MRINSGWEKQLIESKIMLPQIQAKFLPTNKSKAIERAWKKQMHWEKREQKEVSPAIS